MNINFQNSIFTTLNPLCSHSLEAESTSHFSHNFSALPQLYLIDVILVSPFINFKSFSDVSVVSFENLFVSWVKHISSGQVTTVFKVKNQYARTNLMDVAIVSLLLL